MSWRTQAVCFLLFSAVFFCCTVVFGVLFVPAVVVGAWWTAMVWGGAILGAATLTAVYGLFAGQNWHIHRLDTAENREESP